MIINKITQTNTINTFNKKNNAIPKNIAFGARIEFKLVNLNSGSDVPLDEEHLNSFLNNKNNTQAKIVHLNFIKKIVTAIEKHKKNISEIGNNKDDSVVFSFNNNEKSLFSAKVDVLSKTKKNSICGFITDDTLNSKKQLIAIFDNIMTKLQCNSGEKILKAKVLKQIKKLQTTNQLTF